MIRPERRRAAEDGELIPDGTFAKVTMTIRPGGVDGQSEIDQACSSAAKVRPATC